MNKDKVKKITEELIATYFEDDCDNRKPIEITITYDEDDSICYVNLSKMYEGIGEHVNFQRLKKLSELFETNNINLGDSNYRPGCETCDYGSKDEVTITCRDINLAKRNEMQSFI